MKSRFHNNLDGAADMGTYFEMPLRQFVLQMPQYAGMLAESLIDFDDKRYIVRFRFDKKGEIDLEVGYPEDAEWRIGQPDKSREISYPSEHKEIDKLLDEKIAGGRKFITMPLAKYIEMYPDTDKLFKKYKADSKAVCFFRNNDGSLGMTLGSINLKDDDWERITQTLCRE